jgi:hypothetical protein
VLKDFWLRGLFVSDYVEICIILRAELDGSMHKIIKRIITEVEVNFKIILLTHDEGTFLYIHHKFCTGL